MGMSKRNKIILIGGFFLAVAMYFVEGERHEIYRLSGPTMGTQYSIVIAEKKVRVEQDKLQKMIDDLLVEVNRQMSTYIKDSEITQFNDAQSTEPVKVSPDHYNVAKLSKVVADATAGAFDPTVGPLVDLWGFGPKARPTKIPADNEIQSMKSKVGATHFELNEKEGEYYIQKSKPGLRVDYSSVAKGYAVDLISRFLKKVGLTNHLVEIGGEIRVSGKKGVDDPWQVGIEVPKDNRGNAIKRIGLEDYSVATSGSYRNYFEADGKRYSHTIDPNTGKPIEHKMVSVSVFSKDCAMADALATAFMVMGPERAMKFAEEKNIAMYALVKNDGKTQSLESPKFKEMF